MAEVAGLVLGARGIAGLFKACVDNFDIVVRAKEFSDEFDLLCTQLDIQRLRLVLWGESLGLALGPDGRSYANPSALERPDIKPVVEASLNHLCRLLQKASITTDKFELKNANHSTGPLQRQHPGGLSLFRERFEAFRSRLHANQKQKSVLQRTRWAVHDAAALRSTVTQIKDLMDSLESITSVLENLLRRQQLALVHEIESVSDKQSLRLLERVSLSSGNRSISQKLIGDAASFKLSLVQSERVSHSSGNRSTSQKHIGDAVSFKLSPVQSSASPSSYYTAPTMPRRRLGAVMPESTAQQAKLDTTSAPLIADPKEPDIDLQAVPTANRPANVPQNQRLMSELISRTGGHFIAPGPVFESGEQGYGNAISTIRSENGERWGKTSASLISQADRGVSLARRVFLELRSLRTANTSFLSASPLDDRLDTMLACIEGPPDTPYAKGIFWITIRIPMNPDWPPFLKFQTRVFHPNIDCNGNICADYQSWWTDPSLTRYLSSMVEGYSWFSAKSSNRYSLAALLTAICALLASPNVDDPLVPEIAEMYVRDHAGFVKTARQYTERYACSSSRPHIHDWDLEFPADHPAAAAVPVSTNEANQTTTTRLTELQHARSIPKVFPQERKVTKGWNDPDKGIDIKFPTDHLAAAEMMAAFEAPVEIWRGDGPAHSYLTQPHQARSTPKGIPSSDRGYKRVD